MKVRNDYTVRLKELYRKLEVLKQLSDVDLKLILDFDLEEVLGDIAHISTDIEAEYYDSLKTKDGAKNE